MRRVYLCGYRRASRGSRPQGHLPRQFYLDGRSHPKDPNPAWLGHSEFERLLIEIPDKEELNEVELQSLDRMRDLFEGKYRTP